MAEQPDHSGSCMLALYPTADIAQALALPGGVETASMHVTIAYAGKAADVDPGLLLAAARSIKAGPFTARISGNARFTGADKGDVQVALIDAPELEDLRTQALVALRAHGIDIPREHGFTAHISRRYIPPGDPDDTGRLEPVEIPFTAISVVHGDRRTDIPLTAPVPRTPAQHALAEVVKDAYARGWAESGGPMTERVKQGCATAINMALEHPDTPNLIEVTVHLGRLEGVWSKLYQRRDDLIADHAERANRAWKHLATRDLIAGACHDFRHRIGLGEAAPDPADKQRQDEIKQAALVAAAAMLQALRSHPEWRGLRDAIRKAVTAGRAEGIVGAVALAAEQIHQVGLDWDLAFDHAYQALENLDLLWADADGWLGKILDRAAADLGRSLAASAMNGSTYAEMLIDAMDALDSEDADAVSFVIDWALTDALRQGAIDLYASQGVTLVTWVDAGDGRVCPTCESYADNSPYSPADYPELPHPRCRCCPQAEFDLSQFAAWFAVT